MATNAARFFDRRRRRSRREVRLRFHRTMDRTRRRSGETTRLQMIHLIFITIAFTNDAMHPSTSSSRAPVLARSSLRLRRRLRARRQSSTRVMPTDAAPTCVAYDDTRTACIIGTATGELVFRDRASSIDTSGTSPRSNHNHTSPRRRGRARRRRARPMATSASSTSPCATPSAVAASPRARRTVRFRFGTWRRARGTRSAGRRDASTAARARQIAFAPRCGSLLLAAACDDGVVRFYEPRERCSGTAWEASDAFESARPGGRARRRVATRERERSVASVSRRDVLAARWEAHRVRARARRARAAVARRRRDGTRRRRRGDAAIGVERDDDDARRDQSRRRAWVDVCRVRMYRSRDEWGGVDENHRSITTSGRRDELRLERERKRRRHDVRGRPSCACGAPI